MWELDYKESLAPKNWCFWTVVLEKTLESPLDCKEFQPVHPKGNQSWKFIGKTDAEAETPILWPPDGRIDSLEKTLMLGRLKVEGEGDDRKWDGWMASPTRCTWVWVSSGSLVMVREAWCAAVHRVAKRVGHDWASMSCTPEANWWP